MTERVRRPLTLPVAVGSDRNWFDPRLVGSNLFTTVTTVPVGFPFPASVAPANLSRWAIGFVAPGGGGGQQVAPWPEVSDWRFAALSGTTVTWFDYLTYGPLIGNQWYALGGGAGSIRVIEVVRIP